MHGFGDINIEKIQNKPSLWRRYDINMWVDYIELLCLKDGVFSGNDTIDLRYEDDIDNEYKRGEDEHLENSLKLHGEIDDYFKILKYRENHCKSFYPFIITDKHVLEKRKDPSEESIVYLYLLFCSCVSLMDDANNDYFSDDFEVFCGTVFGSLFSKNTEVELYGAKNKTGKYSGVLAKRINSLGKTIGLDSLVDDSLKYNRIPGGDAGLDIISYLKIDNAENIPFAFGQITCNHKEWIEKQNSVLKDNWNHKLKFIVQYPAYMLIPFSFHDSLDRFCEPSEVSTFLVDRIRFIKLAQSDADMKDRIIQHCINALK